MKKSRKKYLERGRRYYKENRKRPQQIPLDQYTGLSEEEDKKIEYERSRYQNISVHGG